MWRSREEEEERMFLGLVFLDAFVYKMWSSVVMYFILVQRHWSLYVLFWFLKY
jgi:hypothetical protein